jgi:isopentenyl phosphate kinase
MRLVLLKLGGSIVTFKNKPLSVNRNAIERISKQLRKVKKSMIIVHGGGSFGHYYSVKYDMHTKPARYDIHGVSVVKCSMVELNDHIVNIMVKNGLNPYTVQPSSLVHGERAIKSKVKELGEMAMHGLIPVTHGDVLHHSNNSYYILSGDALMSMIAKQLRPETAIFALDVDGVYGDMGNKRLISSIETEGQAKLSAVPLDVTGGMRRKMTEAFKMAKMGIDVLMVNGLKPERIVDAVNGKRVIGTVVKGVG